MESTEFTRDELAIFSEIAESTAQWSDWTIEHTPEGRHVITVKVTFVQIGSSRNGSLAEQTQDVRLAKALPEKFMARGMPGWDLLVCDDFRQLLEILRSGCQLGPIDVSQAEMPGSQAGRAAV